MDKENSLNDLNRHRYVVAVAVATTLSLFVLIISNFEKEWPDHVWAQLFTSGDNNSDKNNGSTLILKGYSEQNKSSNMQNLDKFGIKEIYETKPGGREWYVNMYNPYSDSYFILDDIDLKKEADGSWRLGGTDKDEQFNGKYHIIMGVNTPARQAEWRDVEITGYAKIISASEEGDEAGLQWYARGGNHTDEHPCEGTSVKGRLHVNGTANWKKEIWHDEGYTDENGTEQATTHPILDKWIGWKVIIYNIDNNSAVKMESYIDSENNNEWKKVTDFTDSGGWYASSSEKDFLDAGCGRPMDYMVTNSGPVAAFRSDGILWDFKNLSVREIKPLPSPTDS